MLEDRRFGIRLGETIDLDDRVGGWLGVDGDGNGHLQMERGRKASQALLDRGVVGQQL